MTNNFLSILQEPVQDSSDPKKIFKDAFLLGLFISFFLLIFRPFGMNELPITSIVIRVLTYGAITFITSFIFELAKHRIVKTDEPSYTFGKWCIGIILMVGFIALGNYAYGVFSIDKKPSFFLIRTLGTTYSVAIFPIFISGALILLKNRNQNTKIAETIALKKTIIPQLKL